ncbi:39S ribosomal protein L33, mitochondrial [Sitodiplosis mosellana]|uniref:39S ribosomal protein L33, mitochondrial n=1 Tax=Sitodiplosis mosellana TaxID=263140 RepID=UPI002444C4B2|nr:39S ribosomal protein L33, mitochondrial [Sitodiplosis mosellana]
MFLTNVLMRKAKAKSILVLMESAVSGHQFLQIRERLADKLETIRFDPYIQKPSVYRERRKVKSIR